MGLESKIPEFIASLEARVRAAELTAAELIVEAAKERVAVDPNAKTHLRDAIHVEEATNVDADAQDVGHGGFYVIAGDNKHWYGHILEHGSVKMPPQPFLVPALEEKREQAVDLFRDAIRKST